MSEQRFVKVVESDSGYLVYAIISLIGSLTMLYLGIYPSIFMGEIDSFFCGIFFSLSGIISIFLFFLYFEDRKVYWVKEKRK